MLVVVLLLLRLSILHVYVDVVVYGVIVDVVCRVSVVVVGAVVIVAVAADSVVSKLLCMFLL